MDPAGPADVVATIHPCPECAALEGPWRGLELRAEASVFQSWTWIGTHLAEFGPPPLMVTARCCDRVVGLALLGRQSGRIWDLLRTPSLHLNETGCADRDSVMIEYNGILAERGLERPVMAACVAAMSGFGGWREWRLGGVSALWGKECRRQGMGLRVGSQSLAPYADFALFPPGDPLEGLSRNSRQQIRRALRLYEERGPLTVTRPASIPQALDWLDELEALHTPYWQSRGKPGAFANRHFRPFHRRLITDGGGDLLKVQAGGATIGVLYNFRHGGWAYSYQSGFAYEADDRLKPGLVCHLLAMRGYRDDGLRGYRFLAGDTRYKNSLANAKDELLWLIADPGDLGHGLERIIRQLGGRS
jgi:CelD/BcsL family acetyltransferase involved in cellulose biosynthesis